MGGVSGTYAEPGSRTYHVEARAQRQAVARCRHCDEDILLHSTPRGPEWRHLSNDDPRCLLAAAPFEVSA